MRPARDAFGTVLQLELSGLVLGDPAGHNSHLVDLVRRQGRPAPPWRTRERRLGSLQQLLRSRERTPVGYPAADDPEGVEALLDRMSRED